MRRSSLGPKFVSVIGVARPCPGSQPSTGVRGAPGPRVQPPGVISFPAGSRIIGAPPPRPGPRCRAGTQSSITQAKLGPPLQSPADIVRADNELASGQGPGPSLKGHCGLFARAKRIWLEWSPRPDVKGTSL
jgi:hypothetical protein